MPKMFLPDVNVWLALGFDGHLHHPAAKSWFDGLSSERCLFCRLTQQGFLRLATNPSVFGRDAVTLAAAWDLFDQLMQDPRVAFSQEPVGVESHWRSFTQTLSFSPQVWNDAYLSAFALSQQLEVVTFDKAVSQFLPTVCHVLS